MNKEQYLSIVTSWKAFIAEGKHKKYKLEYTTNHWNSIDKKYEKITAYDWVSDLEAMHHFIYALIRKKDLTKAFTDAKIKELTYRLRHWKSTIKLPDAKTPYTIPFGEQFTVQMLIDLVKDRLDTH